MDTLEPIATEDDVSTLVDRFYAKVRGDERLGPIFDKMIGDWDHHLEIMRDFWSAAILGTQRYRGCVMSPHFRMEIGEDDFDRWLALFKATATESLPAAANARAVAVGEQVTQMLRQGMARMRGTGPKA